MKNNPYLAFLKPALVVMGLTVGGFVAYRLIKRGGALGRQIKEGREFEKEKDPSKKLSYPPTQYKSWGDTLEEAWYEYPFGLGTVEETVYNIMRKLKNNNDWLELQKAYGVRQYYSGGFAAGNKTLVEAIAVEDDGGEMRKKINEIFKSKGITYRI
jgi:hypothetical protein